LKDGEVFLTAATRGYAACARHGIATIAMMKVEGISRTNETVTCVLSWYRIHWTKEDIDSDWCRKESK
jgi:hypothetical protein